MHQEHLLRSSFITFPSLFSFFLSFFPFFVVKRSRRNDLSQIIIIITIVMAMIKKKSVELRSFLRSVSAVRSASANR